MAARNVSREDVLQASAALFAEHGFRSTSLELVGRRLGVTRQALYYHFSGKGEILGALFDQLMSRLEDAITAARPAAGEPLFVAMVQAHIEVTISNTSLAALLLHERPEISRLPNVHAAARRRAYAARFTAAYIDGVAEGKLLALDPWITVNTVISAINGVSWWHHQQRSEKGATVASELFDLVAAGFIVRDAVNLEESAA